MYQKTVIAGLLRDTETNSLVNTDNGALQAYKAQKNKNRQITDIKEDVCELNERINIMETDIQDIKSMLQILVKNMKV